MPIRVSETCQNISGMSNVRAWLSGGHVHFLQLVTRLTGVTRRHASSRPRLFISCWRAARCSWSRTTVFTRCWTIIRGFHTIAGGTEHAVGMHLDAVFPILQRLVDADFAAVEIGFYAQCWSCFSELDVLGMKNPETMNFAVGNVTINPSQSVKLLGIEIDSKLNFDTHVHEICQKAARQINALKRLSKFLNLDSRMAIFRSFITSNFGYCSLVWHACSAKNTQKLEKLQLRALRFVYHDYTSSRRPSLHLGRLRTLATEV